MLWEEIGLKFNWWLGQYATAIKLLWKSSLLFYTEVTWLCLDNTMCVNSVSSLLNPLWVKASLWCQWARCRPATPLVLPPPSYLHGLYTHPHWEGLEFSRSSNSTSCLYFFPVTSHMISSHFHYESLPALKPLSGSLSSVSAIPNSRLWELVRDVPQVWVWRCFLLLLDNYNAHLHSKGFDKSCSKKKKMCPA